MTGVEVVVVVKRWLVLHSTKEVKRSRAGDRFRSEISRGRRFPFASEIRSKGGAVAVQPGGRRGAELIRAIYSPDPSKGPGAGRGIIA